MLDRVPRNLQFDGGKMTATEHEILTPLYRAFNARDIDRALAGMRPDVIWANGWEGGNVHGHAGVRDYWTRQWRAIDPHVEPTGFAVRGNRVVVDVHQVVRGLDGALIAERAVEHIFTLEDGLVARFEIA